MDSYRGSRRTIQESGGWLQLPPSVIDLCRSFVRRSVIVQPNRSRNQRASALGAENPKSSATLVGRLSIPLTSLRVPFDQIAAAALELLTDGLSSESGRIRVRRRP
jgi:hypothetical protein